MVDAVERDVTRTGFRGCPFTNVSSEYDDPQHPARSAAADYKFELHMRLERLADEIVPGAGEDLAAQIHLIIDGMYLSGGLLGPDGPAVARPAARRAPDRRSPRPAPDLRLRPASPARWAGDERPHPPRPRRHDRRGARQALRGPRDRRPGPRPALRVPPADRQGRPPAAGRRRAVARRPGTTALAADLDRDLVGRNVIADRWTFQIVEDFDANYWGTFRDFDERARDELAGGDRHVYEARMKQSERTTGHPRHEAGPALAD